MLGVLSRRCLVASTGPARGEADGNSTTLKFPVGFGELGVPLAKAAVDAQSIALGGGKFGRGVWWTGVFVRFGAGSSVVCVMIDAARSGSPPILGLVDRTGDVGS